MKTGDGGFHPSFNVQFATEGKARIIAAVHVTNQGDGLGRKAKFCESDTPRLLRWTGR